MSSSIHSRRRKLAKQDVKLEVRRKPNILHRGEKVVTEEISDEKYVLWFDVDEHLLEDDIKPPDDGTVSMGSKEREVEVGKENNLHPNMPQKTLEKPGSFKGATKSVGIDCEMVGTGYDGQESILARVSLVNQHGVCLYDTFVEPRERVTDYRTHISGIRPRDLVGAPPFTEVQAKVSQLIDGKILVGHALQHDLKVLFLSHPKSLIRDTSKYKLFRQMLTEKKMGYPGNIPSLRKLTNVFLGLQIQSGEHSSIQDAQATMRLYTQYRHQWEKDVRLSLGRTKRKKNKKKT